MRLLLLSLSTICILCHCTEPKLPLVEYFSDAPPTIDTILIQPEPVTGDSASLIPWSKLRHQLDVALFGNSPYGIPDTTDAQWLGQWVQPITADHSLYLLECQYNWFVFQYLLTYSREAETFTDLQTVAAFYGGEGGQVLVEGRLFDWQNTPTLLLRRVDHGLIPRNDSLVEYSEQSATRLIWENGIFREAPLSDSSRWIKAYPLKW